MEKQALLYTRDGEGRETAEQPRRQSFLPLPHAARPYVSVGIDAAGGFTACGPVYVLAAVKRNDCGLCPQE